MRLVETIHQKIKTVAEAKQTIAAGKVLGKTFAFTNLQWEIPGLKINGLPYVSPVIEKIDAGASDSTIIDLTNADWDLRGKDLDSNSLMYIKLNVLLNLLTKKSIIHTRN